jgi:hypothetical protein
MEMKLSVDLSVEELDVIIRDEMRKAYIDHKTVWVDDPEAKKYAKAFKRVAHYYSSPSEHSAWLETVKDL